MRLRTWVRLVLTWAAVLLAVGLVGACTLIGGLTIILTIITRNI